MSRAGDKAFLFYPQDFLSGTVSFSHEERGKYITLLCHMHAKGRMKAEEAKMLVGNISGLLQSKFVVDNEGYWHNPRLEVETNRRQKYVESRRVNAKHKSKPCPPKPAAVTIIPPDITTSPLYATFMQWVDYRKSIRKPLKEQSISGAFNRLVSLSGNNTSKAACIVRFSIDNGYQGLFPLKNNKYKPYKTLTEQWLD